MHEAAKAILAVLVAGVILTSPIWTTRLVLLLMKRHVAYGLAVCGLQQAFAFAVWWFFWGGGIGEEAHLSKLWQAGLLLALTPVGALVRGRK